MREKAQFGECGTVRRDLKEMGTGSEGWLLVCVGGGGGGFAGGGGPDEGDGPGWREGAKERKEAPLRGWGSDWGG